jgi:hypothetical protein
MGAEAASVAKGELRQGDFYSRPRETRAITAGGALAQPKTMSMGGIDAGDSSANDSKTAALRAGSPASRRKKNFYL